MENKDIVLRLFEELDKKNPGIFNELCLEDAKFYMPGRSEPYSVPELIELASMYFDAFPDYEHTIEDVISTGDQIVVRTTNRGTQTGELMRIPPTGKRVEYGEIAITRFENGKIKECWVQEDELWLMQQLGMELKPKEATT